MFHWLDVRAFCHGTEDEEKVVAAMHTILPGEVRAEKLEGHFGNPIVSLSIRVEKDAEIRDVWRRIADALGKDALLRELEARLDEDGIYHLRVDKQRAFLGSIALASSSDIIDFRAKVAAFPNKPEVVLRVVREFLEGL